ncbi:hypothetical protein [Ralstonia sp. UBA689]|uniref:hypothetical protein n=1 Tax=Ralstonia sp. UBA689 TaxID=1947373 RepID=UPI0025ED2F72|nr:hypothetical protein [Ralstonia sp. UBA689]
MATTKSTLAAQARKERHVRKKIELHLEEYPGERFSETQIGRLFGLTGGAVKRVMAWLMAHNPRIVTCGGCIRHYQALQISGPCLRGEGDLHGYTDNLFCLAEVRMSLRGARWRLDQPAGWRPGQGAA